MGKEWPASYLQYHSVNEPRNPACRGEENMNVQNVKVKLGNAKKILHNFRCKLCFVELCVRYEVWTNYVIINWAHFNLRILGCILLAALHGVCLRRSVSRGYQAGCLSYLESSLPLAHWNTNEWGSKGTAPLEDGSHSPTRLQRVSTD